MRVRGLVATAVLVALATVPPAVAGAAHRSAPPRRVRMSVTVMPVTGSRRTHFAVRFRARRSAGVAGATNRRYVVSARGPGRPRCDAGAATSALPGHAARLVRVSLAPDRRGWCRGVYHGRIDEFVSPVCAPGRLCPEYVSVLRNVAGFTFRVR